MRLEDKTISFVLNFLLGVAWATLFLGAFTLFVSYYNHSLLSAIVYAMMGMLPGMFGILLIEHFLTARKTLQEIQKQNKLLEQLLKTDT
jgi:H+/Cl- antiporter ClcA